jgi:hypothetical protein
VTPFGEVGHGVHELPHAVTLVASTQMPLQGFLPAGQAPSQTAFASMQRSRQGLPPAGHETPHLRPSHVALPPIGLGQGSHRAPHVSGETLSTQAPRQVCFPEGQAGSGVTTTAASVAPDAPAPAAPPVPAVADPPAPAAPPPPAGPSARARFGSCVGSYWLGFAHPTSRPAASTQAAAVASPPLP